MPRGSILIVEDAPINLRLTQLLLSREGYQVRTVGAAEAALEMLATYKPELILTDIGLPGMDGLTMTRQIKRNPITSGIPVVALTSRTMKSDRRAVLSAGCDGYISKPIDSRTFLPRIHEFVSRQLQSAPPDLASMGVTGPEFELLRRDFLRDGRVRCQEFLVSLSENLDWLAALTLFKQLAGDAALLGFPDIARRAGYIEEVLRQEATDEGTVRGLITDLTLTFDEVLVTDGSVVPEASRHVLEGKSVALVGVTIEQAELMCHILERVGARPRTFSETESIHSPAIQECNLIVIHVCEATRSTDWLLPGNPRVHSQSSRAMFVGSREDLLAMDSTLYSHASDYLIDPWQPAEFLLRLSFVAGRQIPNVTPKEPRPDVKKQEGRSAACPRVLLADDDPIIRKVVQTVLGNYGMTCLVATSGDDALRVIREDVPQVAVLDVGMPGMDGYELLESIRAEGLPILVVLLTARQQEKDVLRGFRLGADDYLTKPFKPAELVARINRLLRR